VCLLVVADVKELMRDDEAGSATGLATATGTAPYAATETSTIPNEPLPLSASDGKSMTW
jgi:hypothetical protein